MNINEKNIFSIKNMIKHPCFKNVVHQIIKYESRKPSSERIFSIPILLITIWIGFMLSMPFIERYIGRRAFIYSINLSVLIQSFIVIILLMRMLGVFKTVTISAQILFLTWLIEAIGVYTGFPFGSYQYTNRLQPQILNVPLLIPFAWLMMLPPSWAIAYRITDGNYGIKFVFISGMAFTAWDLFLDPQMIRWGLWKWQTSGFYFGIPLSNFFGWFISAVLITVIIRPSKIPSRPLFLIYSLTWIMETVGLLKFWKIMIPAFMGFIGMGIFVVLAYLSHPKYH
ncbi:MAG: carotenoid biosynthesis protein [bacterium]